jgi:c-di-GMP-binding flagellar brake protein YcgR
MSGSKSYDPERRRYPRVKAKVPVKMLCEGAPAMLTETGDISLCGCYIETMFTMEVGTKLTLEFSLAESTVRASGIVVTRFPQVGNGIEFIDITPEARLQLSRHIDECEEETPT